MTTLGTSTSTASRSKQIGIAVGVTVALGLGALYGATGSSAKGGTAKPPANPTPPVLVSPPAPVIGQLNFTAAAADIHQFDVTGIITAATVDPTLCPGLPADQVGGTAVVNGLTITIPCNSVLQMPANTLTWAQINANTHGPGGTANALPVASTATQQGFEASITGNIVAGRYVAGLVYLSQEALNGGVGTITGINYATGELTVSGGPAPAPTVRLQINDPFGRFGRAQSPDDRFSVDDQNPTIHAGTGYPMCVPRTDPAVTDDPLCPQRNRPLAPGAIGAGGVAVTTACRNFLASGIGALPASGELAPPALGQRFCSQFVMPAPPTGANPPLATPDARQQAPFEVGDTVNYAGTLLTDAVGPYISAHTIEANLGIYTQKGTQPVYLAIGEFGIGASDPAVVSINGAAQETTNRIFLESEVTDPTSVVDIYLIDKNTVDGSETNRWITPQAMTGENNGPVITGSTTPIGGGITTQFLGAQPQRARIRAIKTPFGIMNSPTRTVRVVARQHCDPEQFALTVPAGRVSCKTTAGDFVAANGLKTGQYLAPTFEFIFPENTLQGSPIVPNNFWDLDFLVHGEGPGTGALIPSPW